MIKRWGLIFAAAMLMGQASAHPGHSQPHWQAPSEWPDRIIASPGAEPQTSFSVTWRTTASISSAIVELVEATADSRFDLLAEPHNARYERVDLEDVTFAHKRSGTPNAGLGSVHYFSAVFDGLKPDTLYAYRVRGDEGAWSEWFQVRTAPETGPVNFLYYGDAQYGIRSHVARIFRQGLLSLPEADFILHAGDLVNSGDRDREWAEWFDAAGFIHTMIPVVPVAGNHEYLETAEGGSKDGKGVLTDLWRPQFTLPVEAQLPEALHETVYDLRYGPDLHVFVLDSSSALWDEQMQWLRRGAQASDATWKIVAMHHSPFRPGIQGYANAPARGDYHRARQDAFLSAARAAKIDLVLAGHNHSYTRASLGDDLDGGLPMQTQADLLGSPQDVEMVVVVAISGAMSGTMTDERYSAGNQKKFGGDLALQRWANNTPTYQAIRVDGDRLHYESYLATGNLYDAFHMEKNENGGTALTNGDIVGTPSRRFENTGPYRNKNSLR